MIIMRKFISLFALLLLVSCSFFEVLVGTVYGIQMRNDTQKNLVVCGTYDQTIGTRLPDEKPVCQLIVPSVNLEISPYEFIMGQRYDWTKSLSDKDTIRIYIFDSEEFEKTDWSDISNEYLIMQRYDFSKADLDTLGWIISYPPTPEMKDIKMWPPYEEAIKNAESVNP